VTTVKHAFQNSQNDCTKFVFGRGSAPDSTGAVYSDPPDHLAGLRGTIFVKGRGEKTSGREGRAGRARNGGWPP